MRIPLIYVPVIRFKLFVHIEKKYKSETVLIPLGCDCHPAYVLRKLNIRKFSLPFDWLNVDPIRGLEYVVQNITTQFEYFLFELNKNDSGYIVSKKYDYAEFYHEKDLIESLESREKILKRVQRFKDLIQANNVSYLYNLTSDSLVDSKNVDYFYNTVINFTKLLKAKDTLHIYIRHEENFEENKEFCESLIQKIEPIKQVFIVKYNREISKYGIWGNENNYFKLSQRLRLNLKRTFPRIYIKVNKPLL